MQNNALMLNLYLIIPISKISFSPLNPEGRTGIFKLPPALKGGEIPFLEFLCAKGAQKLRKIQLPSLQEGVGGGVSGCDIALERDHRW